MCSLDKLITLCEFASSHYPDGHPAKAVYLAQLGLVLGLKGLEDEAIGAYERALDGIVVDSNGLSPMRICFSRIGALLKGRYDRLGEAEDLHKAIWAQEMCIACTAADEEELDEFYGSLLNSLVARWNLLNDEEDLDRMLSYAEKAIVLNPSNARAQDILDLNFVELRSIVHRTSCSDSVNDRVSGAQDSEFDSAESLADHILRQRSMYPETVTLYEHTILQSLQQDRNMSSLDKLITFHESASSHYPDGHPLKAALLAQLGLVLELKGLEDEAIGAYERALDGIVVDSHDLSLMRICFSSIGGLLKGRYDRLGEAEDLHKAIWAQEMCIACTAADEEELDEFYGSLLNSLGARWILLNDEEDLDRMLSYAEKAIVLNPSNARAQDILDLNFVELRSIVHRTSCSDSVNDRVPGAQDSEIDSALSLEVDDLVRRLFMFPKALTPYEHMFLLSLQRDRNTCSLDKLITLCEFAISHYPEGHPLKAAYLAQLGTVLEMKRLEDEAIGAYERALDGIVVDSNGLSLIRICFSRIGALLKGRYDRLGEAEDLHKAIWAQEICIACTAADGEKLDESYGSLLESLVARWNLLHDEEDLDRMSSYAEKAIALNPSNARAQSILDLNFVQLHSFTNRTFCSDSVNDRVSGAQDSEFESILSLKVDDLVRLLSTFPEDLTLYEHTFLQSLRRDRNTCSLDKLITLCEFAISHYPDGHPLKAGHVVQLGTVLEMKRLEDEAIGAYERALDGIVVDSNGLSHIRLCFSRIGGLLKGRYDRLGEAEDLHKAIWAKEMCIACTAADEEELDEFYGSLLNSLVARWILLNDEEDLDRMLSYAEKAIVLNPSNARAQDILDLNFVELRSIVHRTSCSDSVNDRVPGAQDSEIDSADSLDAHDLVRQWSISPEALTAYEHKFLLSFERDRNVRSLDQAITLCEFAISHYPDGHPLKSGHLFRLGMALEKKGLEDEAIGAYERALDGMAMDSNGLSLMRSCFSNIGDLRKGRYNRLREAEDLHKAIWAQEMCIACTASDRENLDVFYLSLCASLNNRWELLKDKEDLNRMLSYAEKAVELNPSKALNQHHLSLVLCVSYHHHHTLALVDRTILATQSAVSYSMPHDRVEMLTVLATSYYSRFYHVGDPSDASACIKYLDQAMECGKILSPPLHIILINCLLIVFGWKGDAQCYERALLICETLLADDSLSHYDCMTLGVTLPELAHRNKGALSLLCQLEKCIQIFKRAIECTSEGHPRCGRYYMPYKSLCVALTLRFKIEPATVEEFEYAISIGRKAVELASNKGNDVQAGCLLALAAILKGYGEVFPSRETHEQHVLVCRQALQMSSPTSENRLISAVSEAAICFQMRDWRGCIDANTIIMENIQRHTWLGLSVVQQHRVISHLGLRIHRFAKIAALTAFYIGNSEMGLEWIEQCRSIAWRRVLNLRVSMDALAGVEPTLARRLGEVSNMLQRGAYFDLRLGMEEGSLEMEKQQRYRLAEEWEGLVAQTRSLPGFTDFLKPKDSAYFTSCEFGGMVVLLNVKDTICFAIVLGSNKGKVVTFWLEQMNDELATSLQTCLHETLQRSGRHSRNGRASEAWYGHDEQGSMSKVLSVLWTTVVKPLFDFLDLKPHDSSSESDPPRLWWCPTGPLSFLPLHAAGLYHTAERGTKVYEFVASSYTPTIGILADISNQRSEEFSGLLAVCQPHTPGQNRIPKTENEVRSVIQVANERVPAMNVSLLGNDDATPEAVLNGMAEHSWIHLACHARQDPTQPLESAFMLAGDPKEGRPLKLAEIAEHANRNADFAFLSACQTAMGDVSLSEESVHLAASMLMAGYRRVIATMWAVKDSDAPIIAEMVYKYMLSDGKADSGKSCLALHHATASLRQKVGEKNFMSWVPFIHFGA